MKELEEIKELAEKVYREFPSEPKDVIWHFNRDINCHRKRKAFVKGYNQCQEDMADKKYTEDDLKKAMNYASQITNNKMKYIEDYINSLNKQD